MILNKLHKRKGSLISNNNLNSNVSQINRIPQGKFSITPTRKIEPIYKKIITPERNSINKISPFQNQKPKSSLNRKYFILLNLALLL